MADTARVALLARPGPAREQLRRALTELGAVLVAEGDPAELDPAEVARLAPNIALVSLEPAIEPALERFDALLSNGDVEVMYDDADVTRHLEGWDLNRWARHLAAKLLGRDVLPPVPENSAVELDLQPVPGAPPTPAQLMDHAKLEDYVAESPDLAEWVPTNPSLTGDATVAAANEVERPRESDEMPDFELDLSGIESAMLELPGDDAEPAPEAAPAPAAESIELELEGDFSLDIGNLEELVGTTSDDAGGLPPAADEPLLADMALADGPINFSSFSESEVEAPVGMDADVAALAAQLEAFEKSDTREVARDPDFSWAPNDDAAKAKEQRATPARTSTPIPEVQAPSAKSLEFGSLSLLDDDTLPVEPLKPAAVAPPSFSSSLSLESLDETALSAHQAATAAKSAKAPVQAAAKAAFDTGSLSLETLDVEPQVPTAPVVAFASAPGAVLVVAGMGGPDAVRQFLSHLPSTLPVPVLLYQHLEVGKHERLVDQLAKVSQLKVYLALAGDPAQPGKVAVLPAGMGAKSDGKGLRFHPGSLDALVRALPASDSTLVVLSGADSSLVPAANAMTLAGGTAYVQSPDTCFDATAAQAIASNGAPAMAAPQIAEKVSARWPA